MTQPRYSLVEAPHFYTLDDSQQMPVEWLLIKDDLIADMGAGDPPDIPGMERFRYEGTVLPGLIDAHVHLTTTGFYSSGLDLRECRSVDQLLVAVGEYVATSGRSWIIGGNFDPGRNVDDRMPSSAELDAVAPDVGLLISRADGHSCALNSKGFASLDLDPTLVGIIKGADGAPTGVLADQANYSTRKSFFSALPDDEIRHAQEAACWLAIGRGVTSVHEMAGGSFMGDRDFEVLLANRSDYPIEVLPYLATTDVAKVASAGLNVIGGDLFLDGSIGSMTAAMSEAYEGDGGRGHLYHEDDEITEFFFQASRIGMQAGVHAIGDEAIEQALRCIRAALLRCPDSLRLRHRIEHFECVSEEQLDRAAKLGVVASVQPSFDAYWGMEGGMYQQRLGGRAKTMNPFSSMVRRGMRPAGGSDSTVTPLDPWLGMSAAMGHNRADARVAFDVALRMFSKWGAEAGHQERVRGSLEVGKKADLCMTDEDPSKLNPEELKKVNIRSTWVNGAPIFAG